jgi:hypothetical protein
MVISAEQVLAGSALTHEVTLPVDLGGQDASVRLRPLTVRDLQRIGKAAHEDDGVSAALMIHHALVEPALKIDQVLELPAGLARFLLDRINTISGISTPQDELTEVVQAPLAKACFVLAKEFGWTPEQVSGMTIGQILLYLEMTRSNGNGREP